MFEDIRFLEFNDSLLSHRSFDHAALAKEPDDSPYKEQLTAALHQQSPYRFMFDGRVRLKLPYPVSEEDARRYYVPQIFVICECGPAYYTLREGFESYEILYTFEGQGILEYEGQTYTLETGDGFFIDCRKKHHYYTKCSRWVHAELHFDGPQAAYHYEAFFRSGNPLFHEDTNGKLQTMCESMLRAWQDYMLYKQLQVSNDISQIIAHLLVHKYMSHSGTAAPDSISKMAKYIDRHFREPITLDLLSRKASLSKYHLSREFKHYIGMSPIQYLLYIRLENAKMILLHTNFSIQEVAAEVGFSDINNFTRQFRQHTGMTPVRFRKNNR